MAQLNTQTKKKERELFRSTPSSWPAEGFLTGIFIKSWPGMVSNSGKSEIAQLQRKSRGQFIRQIMWPGKFNFGFIARLKRPTVNKFWQGSSWIVGGENAENR